MERNHIQEKNGLEFPSPLTTSSDASSLFENDGGFDLGPSAGNFNDSELQLTDLDDASSAFPSDPSLDTGATESLSLPDDFKDWADLDSASSSSNSSLPSLSFSSPSTTHTNPSSYIPPFSLSPRVHAAPSSSSSSSASAPYSMSFTNPSTTSFANSKMNNHHLPDIFDSQVQILGEKKGKPKKEKRKSSKVKMDLSPNSSSSSTGRGGGTKKPRKGSKNHSNNNHLNYSLSLPQQQQQQLHPSSGTKYEQQQHLQQQPVKYETSISPSLSSSSLSSHSSTMISPSSYLPMKYESHPQLHQQQQPQSQQQQQYPKFEYPSPKIENHSIIPPSPTTQQSQFEELLTSLLARQFAPNSKLSSSSTHPAFLDPQILSRLSPEILGPLVSTFQNQFPKTEIPITHTDSFGTTTPYSGVSSSSSSSSYLDPYGKLANNNKHLGTNGIHTQGYYIDPTTGQVHYLTHNPGDLPPLSPAAYGDSALHENKFEIPNVKKDVVDLTDYPDKHRPRDTVDLTDINPIDEVVMEVPELFGTIMGKLVGVSVFKTNFAQVRDNDPLGLVPDPNEVDINTMRVDSARGQPIGYVDQAVAAVISPLQRKGMVKSFRSWITSVQPIDVRSAARPIRIELHGFFKDREETEQQLQEAGINYIPSSMGSAYGGRGRSGDGMPSYIPGLTMKDIESDLDKLFGQQTDFSSIPERDAHKSILSKLYPYQKQGLWWMWKMEERRTMLDDNDSFFFWEKRKDSEGRVTYYNRWTQESAPTPPMHARGGILADEMGLGKTLQIISLVSSSCKKAMKDVLYTQAQIDRAKQWKEVEKQQKQAEAEEEEDDEQFHVDDMEDEEQKAAHKEEDEDRDADDADEETHAADDKESEARPTLIVCPLSVITNWQDQFGTHVTPNHLTVYTYHGPLRNKESSFLESHDVVITTYNILATEYNDPQDVAGLTEEGKINLKLKKTRVIKQCPLFDIFWKRVVLDEAHIIRDRKTRQSKAACALLAERRWCITGTPMQNKIGDAFALLSFLKVEPFTNYTWWSRLVLRPLKNRDPKGLERLQMILGAICLRRKKNQEINGKKILNLPVKNSRVKYVTLKGQEKLLYDTLASSGKSQFRDLCRTDSVMSHYAYVLEMLLRMRQACDHMNLVPKRYHEGFISQDKDKVEEGRRLSTLLEESETDPCPLCTQTEIEDPCVTRCAHFFCRPCLTEALSKNPVCPTCQMKIGTADIITKDMVGSYRKEEMKRTTETKIEGSFQLSSKLEALLAELKMAVARDSGYKAVVFSQWTSMLDFVEKALALQHIQHVRLDGAMSSNARRKALTAFREDPSAKVFLISLKAGGVGLNLTSANIVYLLDPWWNPAAEDQAIDRVHRLGQTKDVEIVRFIARDSLEEKIVELQKRKREMTKTALRRLGKTPKEMKEDRLQDLMILFK